MLMMRGGRAWRGFERADIYAGFEPIWAALADAQQVLVVHDMEPVGLLGLGAQQQRRLRCMMGR